MGEMAQVFNDMKAATKERREKRAVVNIAALTALGVAAREQSKNVFRVDTDWGAVMYYPSSNTWQHKGKTHRGDVQAFTTWVNKLKGTVREQLTGDV